MKRDEADDMFLCLHVSLTSSSGSGVTLAFIHFRDYPPSLFFFLALLSCFSASSAVLLTTAPLVALLILAARRASLHPSSGFLAPFVQQRIAGDVDVFDFHLIVIHAHGGQSAGHLLL